MLMPPAVTVGVADCRIGVVEVVEVMTVVRAARMNKTAEIKNSAKQA
jgi:hypothetical protein